MTTKQFGPYPNVLVKCKDDAPQEVFTWESVNPPDMIKNLLLAVAPKYPHYRFIYDHSWHEVSVHCGAKAEHKLGRFRYVMNSNLCGKIMFKNFRIDCVRSRGDRSIKTSRHGEAVKVFNQYFHTVSPAEVLRQQDVSIDQCINKANLYERELNSHLNAALTAAHKYILSNWDRIGGDMIAAGVLNQSSAEKINQLRQEAEVTSTLKQLYKSKVGYHVYLKEDLYYVKTLSSSDAQVYDSYTLPPNIKRDVGMLKLLPDSTFVVGVGVRNEKHSFYVLGEDK
jgi:hypothetical protein